MPSFSANEIRTFLHIIPGNDKFKVVFFDNSGHVTMVEESQQRKRKSEANLFVVPFGRYNLSETMPLTMMKRLDEEVPPVFMILDTYDKDIKNLLPGTHLFCVYGEFLFIYLFLFRSENILGCMYYCSDGMVGSPKSDFRVPGISQKNGFKASRIRLFFIFAQIKFLA